MVDLANGERMPADTELRGLDGLARAWGYKSAKRVEQIVTAERKAGAPWLKRIWRDGTIVQLNEGATALLSDGKTYLVPAWYAMELYKHHILPLRIRSPHTPTTGGKSGTRDWGRRATFAVNLDERLYNEGERERKEAGRDYERHCSGSCEPEGEE